MSQQSLHPALRQYVETEIIPRYRFFDKAHGIDHVLTVIQESLRLAAHYPVDPQMVYTAAAYHDTGLCEGREFHHLHAARILVSDVRLAEWFSPGQIETMRQAVEDHRASSEHEPRSIYGRIVAEADRVIDSEVTLRRTVQYGLEHYPEEEKAWHYARFREHLMRKYATGGYLRLWIPESDNALRLRQFRELIEDETRLENEFDKLYAAELFSAGKTD